VKISHPRFNRNRERSSSQETGQFSKPSRHPNRNPFPAHHFFPVPIRLYDDKWAAWMGFSEFKRYLTLLRLANYSYGSTEIRRGLKELEELDGVSTRSAWRVHRRLQEAGLIRIRKTRPQTFVLVDPLDWPLPPVKQVGVHKVEPYGDEIQTLRA
jgi:hypothetical protein